MDAEHPNVTRLKCIDLRGRASTRDVFSEDLVWRFVDGRVSGASDTPAPRVVR